MSGLVRRRLYKPERRPARMKGVLHDQSPVGCADANSYEIAMALASLCRASGMVVGRGGDYDSIKDMYTVVGTVNGKAQDLKIEGAAVAALIHQLRIWNGGSPFDKRGLSKQVAR